MYKHYAVAHTGANSARCSRPIMSIEHTHTMLSVSARWGEGVLNTCSRENTETLLPNDH
jgi:hypothetical protein